jgi:FMN phosphatase YigB (HAD superfamily)
MDRQPLNPATIRNLVLDFGGVLYDIDYGAPASAFAKLGWDSFADDYAQGAQSEIFDGLETGAMSEGDFLKALHAKCANGTKPSDVLAAWNCILIGLPERSLMALEVLSKRYRLFLFSNTNAIHAPIFERQIAEHYGRSTFPAFFEEIVYSHRFGLKKPASQTFEAYASRFGLAPGATLFVDDSAQHVEGAKRAGWHALHLNVERDHLQALCIRHGLL